MEKHRRVVHKIEPNIHGGWYRSAAEGEDDDDFEDDDNDDVGPTLDPDACAVPRHHLGTVHRGRACDTRDLRIKCLQTSGSQPRRGRLLSPVSMTSPSQSTCH